MTPIGEIVASKKGVHMPTRKEHGGKKSFAHDISLLLSLFRKNDIDDIVNHQLSATKVFTGKFALKFQREHLSIFKKRKKRGGERLIYFTDAFRVLAILTKRLLSRYSYSL